MTSKQASETKTATETAYEAHAARKVLFAEIALDYLNIELELGGSELDLQEISIAAVSRALRAAYLAGIAAGVKHLRVPEQDR